jgi:sulfatase maturation enzyme AslB (radical SAM superfamily)
MVFSNADIDLPKNRLSPCCLYKDSPIKVSDGVSTGWFSEHYQKLRQDWINNVSRDNCSYCKETEEDPNNSSLKNQKNKFFSEVFNFLDNTDVETPQLPSVFNIHTTRTCNLACRMCNPVDSSLLSSIVQRSDILKKYYYVPDYKNTVDVESLRGSFKNAELVTFLGGEPMLQDANIEQILKIIREESSILKNVNITTNMTIINHSLLNLLSNLNVRVTLSVSVDGPKAIQEYIRYKFQWDTMIENLKTISNNYPNIRIVINTTISLLSVGYITELLDVLQSLRNDGVNISFMIPFPVVKKYIHCAILPESIKEMYIEKIKTYNNSSKISGSDTLLKTAIDLLNSPITKNSDECYISDFIEFINEFDKIAGTKTTDVYPEFLQFMK